MMTAVNFSECSKEKEDVVIEKEEVVIEDEVSIDFPKDKFTTETIKVKTTEGEREVTYNYYTDLCYVRKPVYVDYQSLNIKVPTAIDGVAIDASNAPMLFKNSVEGYKSVINSNKTKNEKDGTLSSNTDLALAAGYVVVEPGCRGADNQSGDGLYYGKAPAAIVDLKAAVRYLRHNKHIIPGNTDWIISTGVSEGGALSALLGASGNSSMYDGYLTDIGAASEADNIFASAEFCPVADLEHADMSYEWIFGDVPLSNGNLVDQDISKNLKESFILYQDSLLLKGQGDFGVITAENYKEYLMNYYLKPSADRYINTLEEEKRNEYLKNNPWIKWQDFSSTFSFEDYVNHIGRGKNVASFDDFNLSSAENILFGNSTTNARHFTAFSAERNTASGGNTVIDDSLRNTINLMNPMYFMKMDNIKCADYWWIRQGSRDTDIPLTILSNLATSLENKGKNVNVSLYWDGVHGEDRDSEDFIKWIGNITGYTIKQQ